MHIGKSSIARIVKEICQLIWEMLHLQHMPVPTEEHFKKNAEDFNLRWNFPNCVGRIDGKHIRLRCPPNSGSQYFNYKNYYSLVLQGVADANLKFVAVDVGAYGRQSDGGVFRYSALYRNLQNQHLKLPADSYLPNSNLKVPHVLIWDEAYPFCTYLMKPYPRNALNNDKTIFNYRLSRARRVVECAFGICTSKWRILNKAIETKVDTAVDIVKCATLLHNIIIDMEGLDATSCVNQDSAGEINVPTPGRVNNASQSSAKHVRDTFCSYFNSPQGYIPGQENAVRNGR